MQGSIARYELEARIGVGKLAESFRAVAIGRDGRRLPVVVKRVLEGFSRDSRYRARFWREAQRASTVDHPNVIALLDAGWMGDRLFLAFDYVEGADLKRLNRRLRESKRRLTVGAGLHIVFELLTALDHVHGRTSPDGKPANLAHRELAPSSVILSRTAEVKLADVGLAKGQLKGGRIISGQIQGDPRYLAPEALAGREPDARSDLYSVGVLLFGLLVGQRPFQDITLEDLLPMVISGGAPPLTKDRDLPVPLAEAIVQATRSDPEDRFQTAEEFQAALLSFATEQRIRLEQGKLAEFLAGALSVDLDPPAVIGGLEPFEAIGFDSAGSRDPPEDEEGIRGYLQESVFVGSQTPREDPPLPPTAATPDPAEGDAGGVEAAEVPQEADSRVDTRKSRRPTAIREDPEPQVKEARRRRTVIRQKKEVAEEAPLAAPVKARAISRDRPDPERRVPRARRSRRTPLPGLSLVDVNSAVPRQPARSRTKKSPEGSPARGPAAVLAGHANAVAAVVWHPDGKRALSGSGDRTVALWDLRQLQLVRRLEGHKAAVTAVALSGDGSIAVSASRDRSLMVWDLMSGLPTATLEGHRGWVLSVDLSSDGSRAISAGLESIIRLWDTSSGEQIGTLEGHQGQVSQAVFLPLARRAISGSKDGTVRLWDVASLKEHRVVAAGLSSVRALAVSPDGRQVAAAGADPVVRIWDLESGKELQALIGHTEPIAALAFSPDGTRVASAGYDRQLMIWDPRTATPVEGFVGSEAVLAVDFSPDGKMLVSGGSDKRLSLWSV